MATTVAFRALDAGVCGGSHLSTAIPSTSPPKKSFDAPDWAGITDWADEVTNCRRQKVAERRHP